MALRPVDQAMVAERPQKHAVRALWVRELKRVIGASPSDRLPWYLTLGGAQGLDIELLVQEGIIRLTEVESIVPEHSRKIVAVENSPDAVLLLQSRYPGLWIKEVDFGALLRGPNQLRWPDGEDLTACHAYVVNLDLNAPLRGHREVDKTVFPVLEWIRKLCHIHAEPGYQDWTLLLTLHGEVCWDRDTDMWVKEFLQENLLREPRFAEDCRSFLGEPLLEVLHPTGESAVTELPREEQQMLVSVIVPKLVARFAHNIGWRMNTIWNLLYGNYGHAPMVTWGLRFVGDDAGAAAPDRLYREALCGILASGGCVTETGEIHYRNRREN